MTISGNVSENFFYRIINHLHNGLNFSEILDAIAKETRDFLNIDRVKIYQFAEDESGQVIAESVVKASLPSLLGLHFPADDIPVIARNEYFYKHQCVYIDVSAQRKSLHQMSDGKSLNSSSSQAINYISIDSCHIQYLLTMGVISSLTVPIFYQESLWGLIAIHHSKSRRFSEQELETLELLSKEITLAIAQFTLFTQVEQQSHHESTLQQISDLLSQTTDIVKIWPQVLQTMISSLKADGGQLYLAADLTGEPSQFYQAGLQPAIAFLESHPLWKVLMKGNRRDNSLAEKTDLTSDSLKKKQSLEKKDLNYYAIADPILNPIAEAFIDTPIQSLLFIPLRSQTEWMGCLILFRQDHEYTKSWAGCNDLELRNTLPRQSFEAWIEIQRQVKPWTSSDLKLGMAIKTCLYTTITQQYLTRLINNQNAYDSLTKLPNWIIFSQQLTLSLLDTIDQGEILGVFVIALDRFKRINANLSHKVGDNLIQQVTSRLQTELKSHPHYYSLLSRWHGDGFTLLVTKLNYADELVNLAQKLLETFREPFYIQNQPLYLTASIGISLAPYDGETSESLLKYAEAALLQAKYKGKNTYQFYCPPETISKKLDRLSLETDLRKALERDEFLIYYQPQIDLKSGKLVGLEALLRWNHPQLGLVSPVEFIPLAEEMGLIVEIGRWVLKTACEDYQDWQEHQKSPLILSVNLSVRQFQHPGLVTDIFQILQETEMNPSNLELEITESLMMQDVKGTIAILHLLKNAGIQITIDDFGTGYSSLGKLKYLPIHTLKIDKSFVDDLLNEGKDLAIIQCIIDLSKGLNLKVIAEGVETEKQLEKLQLLNCDLVQGYFISRPIPKDEIITFLLNPQLLNIQSQ